MDLQKEKDGRAFNGRRIRQLPDCGFLVGVQKFIEERLHHVMMTTDAETSAARATCGALNWLSRGRPDASGPSSLLSSKPSLTIEDIVHLKQVVDELELHPEPQGAALEEDAAERCERCFVCQLWLPLTGWSLGNAHESNLRDGQLTRTNITAWRSGKLQRIVNSTLAAETQSMSRIGRAFVDHGDGPGTPGLRLQHQGLEK